VTAAAGVLVGLPALRMTGVYLSIATLAFALIIQEVLTRWEKVTGVSRASPWTRPSSSALTSAATPPSTSCACVPHRRLWLTGNLLRSPTGRAWLAIRDSEIAAQSMASTWPSTRPAPSPIPPR